MATIVQKCVNATVVQHGHLARDLCAPLLQRFKLFLTARRKRQLFTTAIVKEATDVACIKLTLLA